MYCPECKAEYREGFTHCADCNVELVAALPEGEPVEAAPLADSQVSADLEAVFETEDSPLLNEIAGLVEGKKIPYLVQSGTALKPIPGEELHWYGVLFVPSEFSEETRGVIHEVQVGKIPTEE